MVKEKISVGIWKRYETYGLEISPSLVSESHEFEYEGLLLKIKLPKRPQRKDWRNEDSPITCSGRRTRGNREYPKSFRIHQVDAIIYTRKTRSIRRDALTGVNVDLFNKREQASLDKLTHRYEMVIDSAFEYWVNVLRWCTEQPAICQLSHRRQKSYWGARLIDSDSEKPFCRPLQGFRMDASHPIKKTEWNRARRILMDGKDVPIWRLYYSEAYERLGVGDKRGFVISLAIASETIIRRLTMFFLKEPINTKYQSLVNRVSIYSLIQNWKKIGFNNSAWRSLEEERKTILRLFELRNGIMHRGENPSVSKQMQSELGSAVKAFLRLGEKNY